MTEPTEAEMQFYDEYISLKNGITDLANLLCDEDRGAPYAQRLAKDADEFLLKLMTFISKD